MKKIPYGISDYSLIKKEDYYFIDKTPFIPELEKTGRFLVWLRPRRFGKSLFIAILEAYYGIEYAGEFDLLFGDTFIGKNKTREAGTYHILRFDFSDIDISNVEESFKNTLRLGFNSFIERYNLEIEKNEQPVETLKNIIDHFSKDSSISLYILIDEYDNFANKLLIRDKTEYERIVTEKTAFFKQFFTVLKAGTSGNNAPVKRMFITGVTPMTMYDVTSGFNIGENISLNYLFNALTGVTQKERAELFRYYGIPDKYVALVNEWYDNYRFTEEPAGSVYNTDMLLYFVKHYLQTRKPPKELIDINVRSDYSKLRYLIYTNNRLNGNFELMQKLIAGENITIASISQDFSGLRLSERDNFVSLFYYLGLLSIKDSGLDITLSIPNETVKRIDVDYIKESLRDAEMFKADLNTLSDLYRDFALNGNVEVFRFFASEIKRNTSIRDYITGEVMIKAMYISYLSFTNYYVVKSEAELNKGFADLFLVPLNPYVVWFALVEFKYIERRKTLMPSLVEEKLAEAKEQLDRYEQDELVQNIVSQGKKLVKVAMVFHGWEMIKCETA
jgi:hypothetical protein